MQPPYDGGSELPGFCCTQRRPRSAARQEQASEKASGMKTHAQEAVMHKPIEVKDKVATPRGWSLLGAIIGAGVGCILVKKAFAIRQERSIGVGSGSSSAAGGYSSNVGTVTRTDVNVTGRAADDWIDRAVENQPLMLALGSMALGVFASLLIPVSSRERQLIEPARRSVASMNGGGSYQGDVGAMRSSTLGAMDRSEELMGAERPGFDGSGSRIPPPPPLDDVSTKIH